VRLHLVKPARSELAARWKWHRALGAAFLGVAAGAVAAAIVLPPGTLATALAWSLLGLAAAYAAGAVLMKGERARGFQAAVTLAYAEAGAVLLLDPQFGPLLLLFALSAAFAIGGVAQVAAAVIRPHAQSRWESASGLLLVALGAMVALQWPLSAMPSLGVAFGLAAAAQGTAYLRLASAGARLAEPRSVRTEAALARLMREHMPG
jgi:uncharacterized membrane protein HdeD (DUF308 family)